MMILLTAAFLSLLGYVAPQMPDMPSVMELVETIGDKQMRSVGDLDDYTQSLLQLAQIHMAKSFSVEAKRYKRALDLVSVRVNATEDFVPPMANPSVFDKPDFIGVTNMRVLSTPMKEYWILGYNGIQKSHAVIEITPTLNRLRLIGRFTLTDDLAEIKHVAGNIIDNNLWIAMASDNHLVSITVVDLVSEVAKNLQVIVTDGSVGGLHMFKTGGHLFLAVGANDINCQEDEEINSRIYQLVGQYFDQQDSLALQTKNVSDITGFAYKNRYYLVFAMTHSEGSQVYRFDAELGTLTLVQQLTDLDVYSVHYFHEKQENRHYIIMNNGLEPKLYRWSNEQLLLWQELNKGTGVDPVGSIQTFTFSSLESIIMVAYGSKVMFYADDVSAHFNSNFVMHTNCNKIGDLAMVKIMNDYVVTYVCLESNGKTELKTRRVIMDYIDLEKPTDETDTLLQCLDSLKLELDSRKSTIDHLGQVLTTDLLMTVDNSQTWHGPLTFTEPLMVNGTATVQQTMNVVGDGTAQAHDETYNLFLSKSATLEHGVDTVNSGMDNILYHSKDQTIKGSIVASPLTVDSFESSSTKLTELNGTPLLSLSKVFMIDGIDQDVSSSMYIDTMKADVFTTRDGASSATINGVKTNQLLRKSLASQDVTGNLHFGDISVQGIQGLTTANKNVVVNGINTNHIVTRGQNATFLDKKSFQNLKILEDLNLDLLNGIDLSSLAEDLVYMNTFKPQVLDGHFTLHDLNVDGNVDVTHINGVDMKKLDTMVVKTSGDFTLSGDVTYQNDFEVSGSMTSPKLNGIARENIVDLQTPHIPGDYTFTDANVISTITCNDINGIDINVDVATIDDDQIINGRLTFLDDVLVSGSQGVQMTNTATINSIHPKSLETFDQGNLVIKTNVTFTNTLNVLEDVTVGVINGLDMSGIEDRYWRKSTNQIILVSPTLDTATFQAAVTANDVNGRQMEDFLSVTGSQTIDGAYTFQGLVNLAGNLDMVDGKTVDGVDVSALKSNLVTLTDDQTITAQTSFAGKISASGSLDLDGKLNGWDLNKDFMRLDLSLPHTGILNFGDKTTAASLSMNRANIDVQSLNGLNVKSAVDDLVIMTDDATVNGPLKFTTSVNVNELSVSGTVDGVDVVDLVDRSLKKISPTPQAITGAITVNKGVHLDQSPSLTIVNGKDWTTHLSKESNVGSKYTITGDVIAKNVNAPVIDGVNTANLVLVDQGVSVGGSVDFADYLEMKDVTSDTGVLDGCDVVQLNASAIWRSSDGSIEMPFPVTVKSVNIRKDATVNGVVKAGSRELIHFLNTLVLKSSNQDISGKVEFITDVTMTSLLAQTADGVDIDNLYAVTVMNNQDSVINCNVAFTKDLKIKTLSVDTVFGVGPEGTLINSLNVSDINANAVLTLGGSYIMTGIKTFTNGLTADGLKVTGSLGGIPVSDLVVVSASGRLADNLLFTAPITAKGDLEVGGLIDNVDLEQLLIDRIRLDTTESLTSSTSFEGIKVEGDLEVEEINGIKLQDIVLKSGRIQQDITGPKTFAGGLKVEGEIQATQINDVDIPALNLNVVRKDRADKIKHNLIFEAAVAAKTSIDVTGKVNGYKLEDINYSPSVLSKNILDTSTRLYNLNSTLSDVFIDTKALACGMYETMRYGELLNIETVAITGKMSYGSYGGIPFLAVRECEVFCTCPNRYSFYHVSNDGMLWKDFNDTDSAFIFDSDGYEGTGLVNHCTGTTEVKTLQLADKSHTVGDLGTVADIGVFSVKGVTYIVTAGTIAEGSPGATSTISVVKLTQNPVVIWSLKTHYSASTVDLTLSPEGWLLLVANHMASNDSVDPFTVPSQLYLWSPTEEKFTLVEEHIGQWVTSGIFLNAKSSLKERYFSLAQLQVSTSLCEDGLKPTTEVMVFKHGPSGYRPYQRLPSYGVVAQESVYIGFDLYLLLLSESSQTLDVYDHSPTEGFRLYQQLPVCRKPIDIKMITVSFTDFLLVSCKEPAQIMKFQFLTKGFTYRE
ncbi:polehole-like protein [Penaeus vannamei]|uniref:Polehole-like protein n=1 Tax=Penaeus vannamei TaxID=6689 RepID=A0A3R7PUT7_PENVA|nr:polehole-like protein [Penaeus vannamei]